MFAQSINNIHGLMELTSVMRSDQAQLQEELCILVRKEILYLLASGERHLTSSYALLNVEGLRVRREHQILVRRYLHDMFMRQDILREALRPSHEHN